MTDTETRRCTVDYKLDELEAAIDRYNAAECGCCSPTDLDEAWEHMTPELAEKVRRFGLSIALSADWFLQENERG